MSRSYKKVAIHKIGHHPCYKSIYNRRVRNSQKIELVSGGYYKKVNQKWEICDYKYFDNFQQYVDNKAEYLNYRVMRGWREELEDYKDWEELYRDWYREYKMK